MIGAIRNNHRRKIIEGKAEADKAKQLGHQSTNQAIVVKNILPFQGKVHRWYTHPRIQTSVALAIAFNFILSIVKIELSSPGKETDPAINEAFQYIELTLVVIFAIELLVNMYGGFWKPFWSSAWNIFDFLVVMISVVSIFIDGLPAMNALRLFRAFRVLRMMKRIGSLKLILAGIQHSVGAVSSAVFLLILIMGIWSIMGVTFFAEDFPALYGDFSKAMLTCFQITTYDSWASGVARPIMNKMGGGYAIYFISYLFVSSIVIMNVIVAVLLDKYLAGSIDMDEEQTGTDQSSVEGSLPIENVQPEFWATSAGRWIACPCCGHHIEPSREPTIKEVQNVSEVEPVVQANSGQPVTWGGIVQPASVVPLSDGPPMKGIRLPKKSNLKPTPKPTPAKPATVTTPTTTTTTIVKPFAEPPQDTSPPVPPETSKSSSKEKSDSFSLDDEEEEDEGLNFKIIDETGMRLNERLDRVQALITPHEEVSQKLLKDMKDQIYRDKVEAQFRRRKDAELSVMKRLAIKFHNNQTVQIGFAILIFANFLVSAVEAQISPLTATEFEVFQGFEFFFTAIFAFELLVNMYANFPCAFWKSTWNWFDFLVVFISLLSLGISNLPGVTVLRLFRAFRVFRLFKRIPSLRKIVVGVAHALPGVASAFLLLGLVMGIWSILGVGFFRDEFPDHYGDFFKAMLTCFQIMTFDGWASEVTRPILLKYGGGYAVYFMSYVFVASIFMSNVVIAILLDKYLSATSDVKLRLDDTRESLEAMEKSLMERFSIMEEYLMQNNLKYAFHSMSPLERKLALQSVQLDI